MEKEFLVNDKIIYLKQQLIRRLLNLILSYGYNLAVDIHHAESRVKREVMMKIFLFTDISSELRMISKRLEN